MNSSGGLPTSPGIAAQHGADIIAGTSIGMHGVSCAARHGPTTILPTVTKDSHLNHPASGSPYLVAAGGSLLWVNFRAVRSPRRVKTGSKAGTFPALRIQRLTLTTARRAGIHLQAEDSRQATRYQPRAVAAGSAPLHRLPVGASQTANHADTLPGSNRLPSGKLGQFPGL